MGAYEDLEYEFVERSLKLIKQYDGIWPKFPFKEQYNYTLLINCLLGLIVMPKERIVHYIPKEKLTPETKKKIGIEDSWINDDIKDLKDLIISLRHSIAHFDIVVLSDEESKLIDRIIFRKKKNNTINEIVKFRADELLPFITYYSNWLLKNLKEYRQNNNP